MKLTHYIAVMCLALVSLVSCKSTEPVTRTASSRVMFSLVEVSGVAEGQSKSYRGVLASKDVENGAWVTNPDSESCTQWECEFVGRDGAFATTRNNKLYPEGTFRFYALGYDGREQLRTENGVLKVVGGENASDYILATVDVALDGVNDEDNVVLNFSHLFAQVRFELIIRSVDITTDEAMRDMIIDVAPLGYRLNGEIDLNADDVKITPTADNAVLGSVKFGKKYMVIPHSGDYTAPTEATISVRFDGKDWDVVLDDADKMTLTAGKCRVIRMTYDGVSFTTAGIPQWSIGEDIVVGNSGDGIKVPQWEQE